MTTMRIVKVDCPYKDCDKALAVEVNEDWASMTEQEKEDLQNKVIAKFIPTIKAHHKDGHPREEKS